MSAAATVTQQRQFAPEETGERAEALYERQIRPYVDTDENIGKLICLDVASGDYEIEEGLNYLDSILRLRTRRPNAEVYVLRIGHPAAFSRGVRLRPSPR